MPRELRVTDVTIAPALEELIEKNRAVLIKTAVADQKMQDKLIEINKLIADVKAVDPGLVGAWGLGCGGSCAVSPETIEAIVRPR